MEGVGGTTDVEKILRESKALKARVDQLERENLSLKKSIYELSTRYSLALHHYLHHVRRGGHHGHQLQGLKPGPFLIMDPAESAALPSAATPTATTGAVLPEAVQELESLPSATPSELTRRDKHRDGRLFQQRYEIKGHSAAVYVVQHSPCGKFLASGSFDRSVKIWDTVSTPKEIACFREHNLNVSDVSWSADSAALLSGAYDQTCKTWTIEEQKLCGSYDCEGFVQCVAFHPQDRNMFFYGTSRNVLAAVDTRKSGTDATFVVRNDAMVNTLQPQEDGIHVVTGDALGAIKTWDIRVGKCVHSFLNEPTRKPLSHIAMCSKVSGYSTDDDAKIFAVNSYDNVIRVYERGPDPFASEARLLHALKGHKNRNWPIKSSFFNGIGFSLRRSGSHEDVYGVVAEIAEQVADNILESSTGAAALGGGGGGAIGAGSGSGVSGGGKSSLDNSVLLATGSADPYAYVYNVGLCDGSSAAELVQRLEGHADRVYAVSFHPSEPILATCSADFSIRIWSPTGRVKKK